MTFRFRELPIVIALLARQASIIDGVRSVMVLLIVLSLVGAPLAARLHAGEALATEAGAQYSGSVEADATTWIAYVRPCKAASIEALCYAAQGARDPLRPPHAPHQ